jgi:CRP-like cAMP-binding protein
MNNAAILRSVPLFVTLKAEDLERIGALATVTQFKKGEVIIREGAAEIRLYVLTDGEVNVISGLGKPSEKSLHTLRPPSYFGEMALIDGRSRSASVVAISDVTALTIDHWDLRKEIFRHPEVAIELLKTLSCRLRALNQLIQGTLGHLAPVCTFCHKIREPDNTWVDIRRYAERHSDIPVRHSVCPECSKQHFAQFYENVPGRRL